MFWLLLEITPLRIFMSLPLQSHFSTFSSLINCGQLEGKVIVVVWKLLGCFLEVLFLHKRPSFSSWDTPNTLQRLQALSSLCCWQLAVRAADPAHYVANTEARGSSRLSACADNAACLGHLLVWMDSALFFSLQTKWAALLKSCSWLIPFPCKPTSVYFLWQINLSCYSNATAC